jgi:VWFA-related protein
MEESIYTGRAVRSSRFSLAAAILSLAISVAAQSSGTPQRPTFTSTIDVVTVDVNVVDKNGRPVEDLGRDDFTLTVDGQARKLTSAQFVSVKPEPAEAAPSAPLPDFSTNTVQSGRLIGLVIDRGSIAPVRARDVLAAAGRFVERLDPADRVALFTIPQGPSIDFTTDHRSIAAALQHIDGQGDVQHGVKNIGVSDALAFEHNNAIAIDQVLIRECGVPPAAGPGASETMMCQKMVKEEAGIVVTYAHERARNTMNGLRAILERLGSSETPKTLVLVSEGMVVDGERRVLEGFGRAAAAAHVTMYALKPETSDSTSAEARLAANPMRDRAAREEGLQYVSSVGGGEMFRVIADPDFAFARVASELSGYYLLGFEPQAGDRDGRSHGISVKVSRDGLSVRSRQEFGVGLVRGRNEKQTISDLLRTAVPATALPVMVTTYMFQDPGSLKVRVLVGLDVDRPASPENKFAIGMVLVDEKGNAGASFFHPGLAASPQSPPGMQRFFATLLTDPGTYELRVAVADPGGLSGSVERSVRAYMRRLGPFRVSDLMIGAPAGGGGASAIVPTVTGQARGDVLHAYFELFAEAASSFDRGAVVVEVAPTADAPALQTVPATLQAVDADPRNRAAGAAISIASLAPGTYVARAVITVDGKKAGAITRAFQVVR